MAEYFFDLSQKDQREALEFVRAGTGRPTHLLEKDIWVVWALRTLFDTPISNDLTFKGGTSLSKVYRVINRFSEDIDLTYDIRKLIPDLIGDSGELPPSRSQAGKWTKAVRHRLPGWITAITDHAVASAVARHKSYFFIEKDKDGQTIDYINATTGHLKIVPEGDAKAVLAQDYAAMLADEVMVGDALAFEELLDVCADLEENINRDAE